MATVACSGAASNVTVTATETVKTPGVANVTRAKRAVFNVLGQLTQTIDAYGTASAVTTLYDYDQRTDLYGTASQVTNTWNWDALNGTGQLEARSSPGFTEAYSYRAADSKLQSVATTINVSGVHSGTYTRTFGYNGQGQLATVGYPSGSTFSYGYNALGHLTQLKSGSTVLEHVLDTDPFGSPTETAFANGLSTVQGYDPATGRITSIETGPVGLPTSIQDLEYRWRSNSTLYQRIDHRNTSATTDDYTDTFAYDALERLTSQVTSGGATRTLSFGYSSWGNLTGKTSNVGADLDVTGYAYGTAGKPHRLTAVTLAGVSNTLSYDGNGNITTYNAASGNDTYLTVLFKFPGPLLTPSWDRNSVRSSGSSSASASSSIARPPGLTRSGSTRRAAAVRRFRTIPAICRKEPSEPSSTGRK